MANPGMYRADHVGSMLRPAELKQFLAKTSPGAADERRALEDAAITRAIALQRELGLNIVTDGEFRRASPADLFGRSPSEQGPIDTEVRFLRGQLGASTAKLALPFKITLPAPSTLPSQLAGRVRGTIQALLADGVAYVQLQGTAYASSLARSAGAGELQAMLAADSAAIAGLARPAGTSIALYLGRGAGLRVGILDDAHAAFAEQLFATMPVDRFVLEVDDVPGGGFQALRHIPPGKSVALGLVSVRTPQVETRDALLDRLDEAAAHFDGSRMAVCPQSGFGDSALSEDQQRRKLELIVSVSTRYWGFET